MANQSAMTLLGVPIDCSGRSIGVERMPAALRAAGLVERLDLRDLGDLPVALSDPLRDEATGIIGFPSVCEVSAAIRHAVRAQLERGYRPLIIGGCCTLLIGVTAALRDHYGRVGLAFVDGHLDYYTGRSSPSGEAADMELAILTGFGPPGLVDLVEPPPLVAPEHVVAVGFRDAERAHIDGALDPVAVAPRMTLIDVEAVRRDTPAAVGEQVAARFEKEPGRFWLHLDLDVLDQDVFPAVDYRMPDGLSWEAVAALVRPLAQSPALVGADVTIYNPTMDPDGHYARRLVALLAEVL